MQYVSAVAFGYFEGLFHLQSIDKLDEEIQRFARLNDLLMATTPEEYLDMFIDATNAFLGVTRTAIFNGTPDDNFLVDLFNDATNNEHSSKAVITHFKVSPGQHSRTPAATNAPSSFLLSVGFGPTLKCMSAI